MRTLLTLTFAILVALAAVTADAAGIPRQSDHKASLQDQSRVLGSRGVTALELSPMYVEIQQVLDQAAETEKLLLAELATATEDEDARRLVNRIERLDLDRTLATLKIQVRYARMEGRWDLEYRLRGRILELLKNEAYAIR